jgi:hypothetical protein
MAQIEVSALDPMEAFETTLKNLLEVTEVFKKNEAIPPLDYLRALQHARETLNAITYVCIMSMQMQVNDRIPQEARDQHSAEIDSDVLARIEDDGDAKMLRLKRLLSPFSLELDLDTDDLPPGFPMPGDAGDS